MVTRRQHSDIEFMARQDKSTAEDVIAEFERSGRSPGCVELLALLEYLEAFAKVRPSGHAMLSCMSGLDPYSASTVGSADATSTRTAQLKPVRSAVTALHPWEDILNEEE